MEVFLKAHCQPECKILVISKMLQASVLKRGQVLNLSCENDFYYHANKTHFHKKGFALGLALRVRVFGTRKWPIVT